jgi:hypothetical protein
LPRFRHDLERGPRLTEAGRLQIALPPGALARNELARGDELDPAALDLGHESLRRVGKPYGKPDAVARHRVWRETADAHVDPAVPVAL